jgi:hypothetical protein
MLLVACSGEDPEPPAAGSENAQDAFWASLQTLCGQAFTGTLVEMSPPDTSFAGKALIMHVSQCEDSVVRVPFFVGEDRSRTWVVSRTATTIIVMRTEPRIKSRSMAVTLLNWAARLDRSLPQTTTPRR